MHENLFFFHFNLVILSLQIAKFIQRNADLRSERNKTIYHESKK